MLDYSSYVYPLGYINHPLYNLHSDGVRLGLFAAAQTDLQPMAECPLAREASILVARLLSAFACLCAFVPPPTPYPSPDPMPDQRMEVACFSRVGCSGVVVWWWQCVCVGGGGGGASAGLCAIH
jgi:hypothetical protein